MTTLKNCLPDNWLGFSILKYTLTLNLFLSLKNTEINTVEKINTVRFLFNMDPSSVFALLHIKLLESHVSPVSPCKQIILLLIGCWCGRSSRETKIDHRFSDPHHTSIVSSRWTSWAGYRGMYLFKFKLTFGIKKLYYKHKNVTNIFPFQCWNHL